MVNLAKIIPKPSTALAFLTSKEMIIVGSAIIGVPLILSQVQGLISKVPFLNEHFTIAFLILGFVIATIGLAMSGIIRLVLMGLGVGLTIGALTPTIQQAIGKIGLR